MPADWNRNGKRSEVAHCRANWTRLHLLCFLWAAKQQQQQQKFEMIFFFYMKWLKECCCLFTKWTTSSWLFWAAQCSGVSSHLFSAFNLMPRVKSIWTIVSLPSQHAQWSKLNPWSSLYIYKNCKLFIYIHFKYKKNKKFLTLN